MPTTRSYVHLRRALLGNHQEEERLERAIVLLGYLADPAADEVLEGWYMRVVRRRRPYRATPAGRPMPKLERLSYLILDAFDGRHVPRVAQSLLDRWPTMSRNERRLSANYLFRSSAGQAGLMPSLERLAEEAHQSGDEESARLLDAVSHRVGGSAP